MKKIVTLHTHNPSDMDYYSCCYPDGKCSLMSKTAKFPAWAIIIFIIALIGLLIGYIDGHFSFLEFVCFTIIIAAICGAPVVKSIMSYSVIIFIFLSLPSFSQNKNAKMSDTEFKNICDSISRAIHHASTWQLLNNNFYAGAQTGVLNEKIYLGGVINGYGGITFPFTVAGQATGLWYGLDFSYRRNFTKNLAAANDYYSLAATIKVDAGLKVLHGTFFLEESTPLRPTLMILAGLRQGEKIKPFFGLRIFFGDETGNGWTFTWEGLGDATGPKAMVGKQWQF